MRIAKVKVLSLFAVLVMVTLAVLPATVLAHEFCRFHGRVAVDGQDVPDGATVTAWLEDPYLGPWITTVEMEHGMTWYVLDIPPDDAATPGKDGGVAGEEVHFSVNYDSITLPAPSSNWESVGFIYHPLRLTTSVIPGDANGDGVVDMLDVTKVERIILGLDDPTPGADANQDGVIDMLDVTKIERIILGID